MAAVLPGDIVLLPSSSSSSAPTSSLDGSTARSVCRLGPGLIRRVRTEEDGGMAIDEESADDITRRGVKTEVLAIRSGLLGYVENAKRVPSAPASSSSQRKATSGAWVESPSRRYIPSQGDFVIGQITHRSQEGYLLSLRSNTPATLQALSFEGATKRNKPNLKVASLIYAKVTSADRFSEPEVSCVDTVTGKAEGLGELKVPERESGVCALIEISLGLARSLLYPSHPLLPALASHFPFEAAVGHNGLVWVRTTTARRGLAVKRVLQSADRLAEVSSFGSTGEDVEEVIRTRGALGGKEIARIIAPYL